MKKYFLAISNKENGYYLSKYFSEIPIVINNDFSPYSYHHYDSLINIIYNKSVLNGDGSIVIEDNLIIENSGYDSCFLKYMPNLIKNYLGYKAYLEVAMAKNNGYTIDIYLSQKFGSIVNQYDYNNKSTFQMRNIFIPDSHNITLYNLWYVNKKEYMNQSPYYKVLNKFIKDEYCVQLPNINISVKNDSRFFIQNIINKTFNNKEVIKT